MSATASSSEGGADRRRERREPDDRPAWLQRGSSSGAVEMVNVSPGGACFVSTWYLPSGRQIILQVGHGTQQATVQGTVVRCTERPDGRFEIGLRIEGDAAAFETMRRFPTRRGRICA